MLIKKFIGINYGTLQNSVLNRSRFSKLLFLTSSPVNVHTNTLSKCNSTSSQSNLSYVAHITYYNCIGTSNWISKSISTRSLSTNHTLLNKEHDNKLTKVVENPYAGLTPAEKVKEAGKDASYLGVILVGVGVTGFMFYTIFRELMSGDSPTGVYKRAFKLCKKCTKITDILGEPLKCYGEETSRGRRRHVSHHEYDVSGVKHMRLIFYIQGPHGKGTVNLEVKKNDQDKYDYRYLFVQLDDYPHRPIILEDNR